MILTGLSDLILDAHNKALVLAHAGDVLIMKPARRLSRLDALNLAAWIVAIADRGEFEPLLQQIKGTARPSPA